MSIDICKFYAVAKHDAFGRDVTFSEKAYNCIQQEQFRSRVVLLVYQDVITVAKELITTTL